MTSSKATMTDDFSDRHTLRASEDELREFAVNVLTAAGTSIDSARSVANALTETSLRGVDSHGIRLLPHYVKAVQGGRINPNPNLAFTRTGAGTGTVDGDNGFGHYASYFAMDQAVALARENGVGAVSVINSSHFGAAGSYALRAAQQGLAGFSFCNSDSFVLAHDGIHSFHGTNPIAFAAPVPGEQPFLLDMATSVVPWNRVQDYLMEGLTLPPDVTVDSTGEPTMDAAKSDALLPLGGMAFGFKGAGLASMIEVLCAVMTGSPHCSQLPAMKGPDFSTPRRMGHFFLAIDYRRFVAAAIYEIAMRAYLQDLRCQPAKTGRSVMAPGDREWSTMSERQQHGIPVMRQLRAELDRIADALGIKAVPYKD
ncbi:MAG TPA: Ldh family oxidoreductase [Terracidiphilus sp.]|nr:Ldh family oxidoreductase [Terracidiphilus sp.]